MKPALGVEENFVTNTGRSDVRLQPTEDKASKRIVEEEGQLRTHSKRKRASEPAVNKINITLEKPPRFVYINRASEDDMPVSEIDSHQLENFLPIKDVDIASLMEGVMEEPLQMEEINNFPQID